MAGTILNVLLRGLPVGVGSDAARQLLRLLDPKTLRPRVLLLRSPLQRAFLSAGCEVRREDHLAGVPGPEDPVDLICSGRLSLDLLEDLRTLSAWVRPGGVVVLQGLRGREDREQLCAGLLHAGLRHPVQITSGVTLLTAGRRPGPYDGPPAAAGSSTIT